MDSSTRGKLARAKWKQLGLCARCGVNPSAPGRVKCQTCLEVTKNAISAKQKELVAQGRCGACGDFRGTYKFYCNKCQAIHSARAAEGARRRAAWDRAEKQEQKGDNP